jgi:signal peptidase II
LFTVVVVVVDQITKLLVRYHFEYGKSLKIIGNYLRLTYIENPGMAFGIQIGAGQKFFTVFATVLSVIIFIYIVRTRHESFLTRFSLSFILGGAIGNLIDRFLYGRVVDFIDVGIGDKRWPIFNGADTAVTIGMIILVALVLFDKNTDADKEEREEAVAQGNDYPG